MIFVVETQRTPRLTHTRHGCFAVFFLSFLSLCFISCVLRQRALDRIQIEICLSMTPDTRIWTPYCECRNLEFIENFAIYYHESSHIGRWWLIEYTGLLLSPLNNNNYYCCEYLKIINRLICISTFRVASTIESVISDWQEITIY